MVDEPTFLRCYDEDHIPEVVTTSGIKSGFRFVKTNRSLEDGNGTISMPFLAVYPLEDLAFTTTDEFRNIRVQSNILPGGGIAYDLADFNVSYFGLNCVTELQGGEGTDAVTYALTVRFFTEAGLERDFMFATVSLASGYIRTLSFQLQHTHSNAQSREPTTGDSAHAKPTSWLCIHEFSHRPGEVVIKELAQVAKYHIGAARAAMHLWKLERKFGHGNLFT